MTSTLLNSELREWNKLGKRPRLFLRDDDALDVSGQLERLQTLCARWDIPVLVAVIPNFATEDLAKFINQHPLLTPAVHGFAHTNHAGANEKKCELGDARPTEIVLEELATGRKKLQQMFGETLSGFLVPPWNRIGAAVAERVEEAGFGAISGFGIKTPPPGAIWVNTHVDIIDWKNNKVAKGLELVMAELANSLAHSRQHDFHPVGVLTHHLVHSDAGWEMLSQLCEFLADEGTAQWVIADELI